MESRRAASATAPSSSSPELSGPRWTSVALIARSRSGSTGAGDAIPQIPHIRRTLRTLCAGAGNDVAIDVARRDRRDRVLERVVRRLLRAVAPEEAGLPPAEPRLVDQLEVEERADARLAVGE